MMDKRRHFDHTILPHLDAGYNLACRLLRDEFSAHDVVQNAAIQAFRFLHTLRGDNPKSWFLSIVRNACMDHFRKTKHESQWLDIDDETVQHDLNQQHPSRITPESIVLDQCTSSQIDQAINALAPAFREVIVLREIEEMSYQDIAQITNVPLGTVMSRLSRAREILRATLTSMQQGE